MQEQLSTAQKAINTVIEFCIQYGFQILGAVIVLILGMAVSNWVSKMLMKLFAKKNLDVTLSQFMAGAVRVLIMAFAVIIAMGKFGISIAPFVAALSAVAFGASLALQGPLSNYGAGIGIILGRPFIVGNTISVAGVSGVVKSVKLACTVLVDEDGVEITVPNKEIAGQIMHNSKAFKLAEGVVGISYSDAPEKGIQIIREVLARTNEVAKEPKPQVGIQAFGDSSINLAYRYWIPTVRFFEVSYAVNLAVFQELGKGGLTIPFPQREVRVLSQTPVA